MKTENQRINIKSLLLGAFVGASIVLSVAAATTSGNRTTWEYRVVQGTVIGNEAKLEDAINRHAAQGWDFVSASPAARDSYGFAIMRREKQ